ncbi:hypothetical protein RFI_05372 [Reticulomyxa filosa]|uniref:Uncharacterized protein n=1 Tax=Reticulomyxa filosa TaxID=46433 RepID=X6P0J0_RETFI|nr:hypothetical protein RFI_05372 [Reticulomyxa filosa]|eukprot:ETO31746.1 hypothetical protein RFI_05372 [Reticulomyxa filosa]
MVWANELNKIVLKYVKYLTKPLFLIRTKNSSGFQISLEHKLQEIISIDDINLYYVLANDFINSILDKYRESRDYDKKCQFSCIYGVTLSGCVQKQLAIPKLSCGYLVFLYHLKEKHLDHNNLGLLQNKHEDISKWIKQSIEQIKRELRTNKIQILEHSRSILKMKWKGVEYHIAIAWTFSKRQYCEFHYIQHNVHVHPFSMEQLQMAANDLIDEAPIHQRHIEKANEQWKNFLEENMSASLSLLRVYYMREELVGKNTRLAVLFLKLWQYTAMKGKQHLSNNSLEIICAHLFEQLKTYQSNTPILAFDIIRQFFEKITESITLMNDKKI